MRLRRGKAVLGSTARHLIGAEIGYGVKGQAKSVDEEGARNNFVGHKIWKSPACLGTWDFVAGESVFMRQQRPWVENVIGVRLR